MSTDLTERQRRILAAWSRSTSSRASPCRRPGSPSTARFGRVVGDGAQHPGAARGAGPRPSAAHLGRTGADRFRLSAVRRRAARVAQAVAPAAEIEARLRRAGTVGDLLENASQELSRASHHIGFALAPAAPSAQAAPHRLRAARRPSRARDRRRDGRRRHASRDRHRGAARRRACSPQAANYINREFAGLTLHEARTAIVERMRQERMLYDALMSRALQLAQAGLDDLMPEETLHVQGASFLVDELLGESADRDRTLETLRALFRMIEEKHRLVELLEPLPGHRRAHGRHRVGAHLAGSAPVQPGRVDVQRRLASRDGRRHRSDAHAVSARHLGRRQRVADAVAVVQNPLARVEKSTTSESREAITSEDFTGDHE